MFGFVFGTICLLGLVGMARGGGGCGHHGYNGGHSHWSGYSRRSRKSKRHWRSGGGPETWSRVGAEMLKRRLDIDEDQEGIVDHAFKDVVDALKELRDEHKETRDDLAEAFRGDEVDDARLATVFSRHDDATSRARRQVVSAFKQIHAVLDEKQREEAADLLAKGHQGHGGSWI